MDFQLFKLLDNHNNFRFEDISKALNHQPLEVAPQYHPSSTCEAPSSRIHFTPDTPDSSTAPMSHIHGQFTFPPDPVPFPSGNWLPSSTPIPNPKLNSSKF